jgi:hypothetical protein
VTGEGVDVQLAAPIEIAPETLVNLADTGAVAVSGETVAPGKWVRLTLTFESGQTSEINTPVVPAEDEFSDIEPADPDPSATPAG